MCDDQHRLRDTYANAVVAYSDIKNTFKEMQGMPDFDQVLLEAEAARIEVDEARRRLERHIAEHGCGAMAKQG